MKKISPKNNKNNWSDSEHTQLSQNRNDERFGMTIDSDELPYNFSHSLFFLIGQHHQKIRFKQCHC